MATAFRNLVALSNKIPNFVKTDSNPLLYSVMVHTSIFNTLIKRADYELKPLGRKNCIFCRDRPMDLRCQRTIMVTARETASVDKKLLRAFRDESLIPHAYNVCQQILYILL